MSWRDQAMCRNADPALFFPRVRYGGNNEDSRAEARRNIGKAKRVCAACLVTAECLNYALQTQTNNCKHHNCVLGGLTYRERVNVLNARVA